MHGSLIMAWSMQSLVNTRAGLLITVSFRLQKLFFSLMHVFYGIHELIPSENGWCREDFLGTQWSTWCRCSRGSEYDKLIYHFLCSFLRFDDFSVTFWICRLNHQVVWIMRNSRRFSIDLLQHLDHLNPDLKLRKYKLPITTTTSTRKITKVSYHLIIVMIKTYLQLLGTSDLTTNYLVLKMLKPSWSS